MKRYTKAVSVIILIMSVIYASGCKKYYWSGEGGFITLDVSGHIGGYEYVDLGLPSGLLWATCNVGARTPEIGRVRLIQKALYVLWILKLNMTMHMCGRGVVIIIYP